VLPVLPASPADIAHSTWSDLAPLYQALADEPLTPTTVRAWLAAWSGLDSVVEEAYAVAMIAYTADTRDSQREAAYLRWATEIVPKLHEVHVRLGRRLLPLEAELPDLAVLLRETRTDIEIFREANLPRMAEHDPGPPAVSPRPRPLTARAGVPRRSRSVPRPPR
jgi:hypothetical protein